MTTGRMLISGYKDEPLFKERVGLGKQQYRDDFGKKGGVYWIPKRLVFEHKTER
jgi:hypothetical protein